jgi:hypothetical protein
MEVLVMKRLDKVIFVIIIILTIIGLFRAMQLVSSIGSDSIYGSGINIYGTADKSGM